jgi:hypothetical protein
MQVNGQPPTFRRREKVLPLPGFEHVEEKVCADCNIPTPSAKLYEFGIIIIIIIIITVECAFLHYFFHIFLH